MFADKIAPFLEEQRSAMSNGASNAPGWLKEFRELGRRRFAEVGFPTTGEEAWRFTSVRPLLGERFRIATGGGALAPDALDAFRYGEDPIRLVFVDGHPVSLGKAQLPLGVTVSSLADAVDTHGTVVSQHLGTCVGTDADAFAALNAAFAWQGAFVHVQAGVEVGREIELLFLTTDAGRASMTHPRTLVVLESEAAARIVETYGGPPGTTPYLTNATTECILGDGARLETCRVQRESSGAFHVGHTASRQARDSRLTMTVVPFGSRWCRHDLHLTLEGEGAEGTLNGLYVIGGSQHVDHHTTIEHATPHGTSHEYFNGILSDEARAVFTGRIIVRPGAQKTDSKQTNNNLLLSESARADSQPQLEIYADDVRCTHGATLGPLDDEAMFYLESRGIPPAEARDLMTLGFGNEILERVNSPAVRRTLDGLFREQLRAVRAGRREK